jgi:hypothetical protein
MKMSSKVSLPVAMSTDNQPETKKNEKVAKAVEKAGYDNRRL